MSKPSPAIRRAATNALDAWVLGMVAQKARESCPSGDVAFSAFLSEVAGDPFLSKMEYAKIVRVDRRRSLAERPDPTGKP